MEESKLSKGFKETKSIPRFRQFVPYSEWGKDTNFHSLMCYTWKIKSKGSSQSHLVILNISFYVKDYSQ